MIACLPAKAGMMKRFEFAAREHQRNSHYQLWTHENHAIELFTPAFTQQKLDYIHNNPGQPKWQLCTVPEDYKYSSALFYHTGVDNWGFLDHWRS